MPRPSALLALALLGLSPLARAETPVPGPRVVVDPESRDALLAAFNAHFFPERLGPDAELHAAHRHEEGVTCLTGLVANLKAHWHLFTAEERAEMTRMLAPWKADLLDPRVPNRPDGTPPPPEAPCFGYTYENNLDSEHFSISWKTGTLTETQVENFMNSLEDSWTREVDELGWREPAGVNREPMMIVVEEGGYAGAYTTIDSCPDGRYVPYIVAYEGSFFDGSWYKIMACHEFNHASQYSYGMGHEFWWWEATATYIEEQVYPSVNDWANMIYSYSTRPDLGMNSFDVRSNTDALFWHTYGMGIWAFYLDQHVGGHELVQDTWDYARSHGGAYDLWMPDVIDELDLSFDEVYLGFITTNAVVDYDERNLIQEPSDITVTELPAEGGPKNNRAPQSLGQNFIRFDADLGGEGKVLEVAFDGDDAPHWYAAIVRGTRTVEEVISFTLDDAKAGVVTVPFDGSSDLVLVVSPKDDEAQGYRYRWDTDEGFQYTYTARYYVEEDTTPDDTGEEEGAPVDATGGDDSKAACGCASSGPQAGLGLLLGALALAAGRRRR
jgi:MYXO-CTERM domain-containing protein